MHYCFAKSLLYKLSCKYVSIAFVTSVAMFSICVAVTLTERASYTYFMKHPLDTVIRIPDPKFTTNRFSIIAFFKLILCAYISVINSTLSGENIQYKLSC